MRKRPVALGFVLLSLGACATSKPKLKPSSQDVDAHYVVVPSCVDFPLSASEQLLSNSDTGARKIQGEIIKSAAVKSKEKVRGDDLWFISINVGGTVVTLAHNSSTGPEGAGLYASIDSASERATSFPSNPNLKSSIGTDGARQSQDCVG